MRFLLAQGMTPIKYEQRQHIMQKTLSLVAILATLGLAACSQGTDLERAMVGGAAGCVAGELIDDGECLVGAAIGAGAGALADDFNF